MARTTRLELPADTTTWQDRHDAETDAAYAAYVLFRDLGPARTLLKAAREYHQAPELTTRTGKYRYVQEWARLNRWNDRVQQHDTELAAIGRLEQVAAVRSMKDRHAKLAVSALEKAAKRLEGMDVDQLSARDVLAFITEATKVERLARGEPDQITEMSGPGHGPIRVDGLGEGVTDEQLAAALLEYADRDGDGA